VMKACDEDHPPNCHPAEALSGVEGAVEGSAVFFLGHISVTTLGCPILAQRGWETIRALSSIAGPALKRFALSQVRPIPERTLEFTPRTLSAVEVKIRL
jgi:hypothetical protein